MDAHPEETCERCGGPNVLAWSAPSPLWNAVMRDDVGLDEFGIVCPQCFTALAEAKGIHSGPWRLAAEHLQVELPNLSGDGRIWNPLTNLWEEPRMSVKRWVRVPAFASRDEEHEFWETTSLTDIHPDDLAEVPDGILEKPAASHPPQEERPR